MTPSPVRSIRALATMTLVAASLVTVAASSVSPAAAAENDSTCHLDHGIKHVIHITFDNVHFFRDNPNVPSDLEQMPNLLNFLKSNGTVLSNTPNAPSEHNADRCGNSPVANNGSNTFHEHPSSPITNVRIGPPRCSRALGAGG